MPVTDPTVETANATSSAPPLPRIDRRSLNVPNFITLTRLVLAVVLFAMISLGSSWIAATILFVVAAVTGSLPSMDSRFAEVSQFILARDIVLWATVPITIYSGVEYTYRAYRMLRA